MRFAELLRAAVVLLGSAVVAGCAVPLGGARTAAADVPAPVAKAAARPASASAAAPAAAASGPAPVVTDDSDIPVHPSVQRPFDEARRALRAGRTDDAERAFKALTQQYPELGGPHANLGLIYRQANKPAEAVAELEQAVRTSPRQPVYFNQLGLAYRANGQFTKAREAYERAIALDDRYPAALLNLGILSDLYLGDGARALALYERYLALTPGGDATVTKWIADLKNRKPAPKEKT